jgi:hypothetical protein
VSEIHRWEHLPCLENPGVWGKAPVAAGRRAPEAPWNNRKKSTIKLAADYDQSVEIATFLHDDNLANPYDINSAFHSDGAVGAC